MDILTLQGCLREILGKNGAIELPVFPGFLMRPWCHPDLLLFMKRVASHSCFVFQPLQSSTEIVASDWPTPELIWKTNFSVSDFYLNLLEFFETFTRQIIPDRPEIMFSLKAEEAPGINKGERQCAWKLRLAGAECGCLFLFSEILGEELPKPSLVLNINLSRLCKIIKDDKSLECPEWQKGHALAEFPSLLAWQNQREPFSRNSAETVLQELIGEDFSQRPEQGVAIMLNAYCTFAKVLDGDKLFAILAKPLNSCLKRLASEKTSTREVLKNA